MNLIGLNRLLRSHVKSQSPVILSCIAGVGVLATAFLASKATVEAVDLIKKDSAKTFTMAPKDARIHNAKLVWKLYIPTGISAVTTIACVTGANRIQARKTLAAQAAFAISERGYSEYRNKVIEEFGDRKDESIRDSIAEDRVASTTPEIIIAGSGGVLCCELQTMRYFDSDVETLRRAENQINAQVLSNDYATLDDFYHILGLAGTKTSGNLGWKSGRLLNLYFTSMLTQHDVPCLAIDYNYIEPL